MIQSHAYVCNTMFCIFTLLIGYILCLKPYRLELIGILITMGGIASLFSDPEAERVDGKTGSFATYSICIGCALLASFYFILNDLLIKALPIFTLILVQAILTFFYQAAILAVVYSGEFKFFSVDTNWGAFGFFTDEPVAVICYALSGGFFGVCGYVLALLFFSPVIVSASFLLEPFVG